MAVPTLSGLPTEVLLDVQASLSYASQLALHLTCRELYAKLIDPNRATSAIPPPRGAIPIQQVYNMHDLLKIELWPAYNGAQYRAAKLQQPIDGEDFLLVQYA
jgi:hypothetical protein